jgi:hypothetical protein
MGEVIPWRPGSSKGVLRGQVFIPGRFYRALLVDLTAFRVDSTGVVMPAESILTPSAMVRTFALTSLALFQGRRRWPRTLAG